MKDVNGFPIYNFKYERFATKIFNFNDTRKVLSVNVSTSMGDEWFLDSSVGLDVDDQTFDHLNLKEFSLLLDYYINGDMYLPTNNIKNWINKMGGKIIHNKSYIVNNKCCKNIDTNACGLLSFFGEDLETCSCKLRSFLRRIITENDKKILGPNWTFGTSFGQTISEDQLGIMAKYLGIKLYIIQLQYDKYRPLRMGALKSNMVRIIFSDGSHFESIFFND